MKKCNVFIPIGALGMGVSKKSVETAIALSPDIIACDAGSTDSGPYYLGTGTCKYARESIKRDLRLIIEAGQRLKVPVVIGSCGTCGSDRGVDENADILAEICQEADYRLKLAKIYSGQNPETLIQKYQNGKIIPLEEAPEIGEYTFLECSNIVALAGVEPFVKALEKGVDVILCGRATDTAAIAALPLIKGCDPASVWHAAKIGECGGICATKPTGGLFLWCDEEGVTIQATEPGNSVTVYSASAHMLYENTSPYEIIEPGVFVDVKDCVYTAIDDDKVRITGAVYQETPYTLKLEGSGPVGYQTLSLVGIVDDRVLADPITWIDALSTHAKEQLKKVGLSTGFTYSLRAYGYNAVTGMPPSPGQIPCELGLLLTVTANTQELATKVAKIFNPILLHFPVAEDEQMTSFAFPFSPAEVEKGIVYEFKLNHIVKVDDPMELIRIEYSNISPVRKGDN